MEYEVEIQQEQGRYFAVTRFEARPDEIAEKVGVAFGTVADYLGRHGMETVGPAVSYYDIRPDGFGIAAGFVVAGPFDGDGTVVPLQLPAGEVAVTTHLGAYEELPHAYAAIQSQMKERGRELDESAMWEEYWSPPETPVEETKTVVYWPLR